MTVGIRHTSSADADRLARVIDANSADLLSYFLRRVDVAEDAGDLLSETMLTTWRHIRSLPAEDERARMWMFGTARRVLANHHRGVRRKSALTERLRNEINLAKLTVEEEDDDLVHVREAVNALSPKVSEVVKLVHWEGFSLIEAASILGTSASTVRSRYAQAKSTLQESLAPSDALQTELWR